MRRACHRTHCDNRTSTSRRVVGVTDQCHLPRTPVEHGHLGIDGELWELIQRDPSHAHISLHERSQLAALFAAYHTAFRAAGRFRGGKAGVG